MIFPRSPVLRLTLWYVLIIMVISIMFSAIIYELTMNHVRANYPPQPHYIDEYGEDFPFIIDDRVSRYFQDRYDEVARRLKISLSILNAVVLGGASLASYSLAKRTLRPIETALDEQRQFTADASHELRTPLAAMRTEIEVSLKDPRQSDRRELLKSNLEEIGRLDALAGSLLKLARHETEQREANFTALAIETLLVEAVNRVLPLADEKHMAIERDGTDANVRGDRPSLVDVFVIILENAVKYSRAKSPVGIRTFSSKDGVTVAVTDQGIGIPAADLPHVFQRFYRVDSSRTKGTAAGFGLGLAIAKQIVERHGGSITIESELGKGTAVQVWLPKDRPSAAG